MGYEPTRAAQYHYLQCRSKGMPICLRDFQDLPCFYAVCGAGNFSSFTGYEPFCTVTKSTMLFKICLRDFRKRGTKEVTSKLEKWHKALPTLLLCNHQPKHLYTIYQKGIAYYFHHCNPSGCYHSHPRGASCRAFPSLVQKRYLPLGYCAVEGGYIVLEDVKWCVGVIGVVFCLILWCCVLCAVCVLVLLCFDWHCGKWFWPYGYVTTIYVPTTCRRLCTFR